MLRYIHFQECSHYATMYSVYVHVHVHKCTVMYLLVDFRKFLDHIEYYRKCRLQWWNSNVPPPPTFHHIAKFAKLKYSYWPQVALASWLCSVASCSSPVEYSACSCHCTGLAGGPLDSSSLETVHEQQGHGEGRGQSRGIYTCTVYML